MLQNEEVTPSQPEYTEGQLRRIAVVYEFLARALPTEGRDYGVRFIFPDPNDPSKMSVRMEPYTSIGKLWCDYCTDALRRSKS